MEMIELMIGLSILVLICMGMMENKNGKNI